MVFAQLVLPENICAKTLSVKDPNDRLGCQVHVRLKLAYISTERCSSYLVAVLPTF